MSTPQDPYNQPDSTNNPYANTSGDQTPEPYAQDGNFGGNPYGSDSAQNGYQQNGYGQTPYGQADYGQQQNGYGQAPYGQGQYNQDPYGQQYQQPYGAYGQQPYVQPAVGQKSKIVAGILGILLGSIGVHNFYLGYTGKAIAQLLITVVSLGTLSFVSAVWGLIEGIMILVSKPGTAWHRDSRGFELQD